MKRYKQMVAIDLRWLAATRIATGLLILSDLAVRALDLRAHYIGDSIVRGNARGHFATSFSAYGFPETEAARLALYLLTCATALSYTLGYRCKLAAALLWFLLVSLHAENPVVLSNGDILTTLLLLWSLFLPVGARLSVWRARQSPLPDPYVSVAGTCFLVQIALVLAASGLGKLSSNAWTVDGTAVTYALAIRGTDIGSAMLALPDMVLRWATWAALLVELATPLMLFSPIRRVRLTGVALGVGLMLGIALSLNVGVLPLLVAAGLLSFVRQSNRPAEQAAQETTRPPNSHALSGLRRAGIAGISIWILFTAVAHTTAAISWMAVELPIAGRTIARTLGLKQHWQMFADPPSRSVRLEVVGEMISGSTIDPRFASPSRPYEAVESGRTRGILEYRRLRIEESILTVSGVSARERYVSALCRNWNNAAPEEARLQAVEVFAVWRARASGEDAAATGKIPLGWYPC